MTPFYRRMYRIFAGIIRKLYRIHVTGAENIPETGGVILAANHTANADVVVLAASAKRQVHYMAKAELFRVPLLSCLIRALGAFSVERGKSDVGAVKTSISLLKEGEVVGIYPQGTRCPRVDPETTRPKAGVAMMAMRAEVPVVPALILTKGMKVRMFHRTEVRFGQPISPEELLALKNTGGGSGEYRAAAEFIFFRILDMYREDRKKL